MGMRRLEGEMGLWTKITAKVHFGCSVFIIILLIHRKSLFCHPELIPQKSVTFSSLGLVVMKNFFANHLHAVFLPLLFLL